MSDNQDRQALGRDSDFALRWREADPVTRRYMLDGLGRDLILEHEAPAPPVFAESFEDQRLLGQYCDEDFRIDLNERLLENSNPHEALDVYLHEYRHAWQHYEVEKSHGALAHETDLPTVRAMEESLDNYVDPSVDEQRYRDQLAESDAREFASRCSDEVIRDFRHEGEI